MVVSLTHCIAMNESPLRQTFLPEQKPWNMKAIIKDNQGCGSKCSDKGKEGSFLSEKNAKCYLNAKLLSFLTDIGIICAPLNLNLEQ